MQHGILEMVTTRVLLLSIFLSSVHSIDTSHHTPESKRENTSLELCRDTLISKDVTIDMKDNLLCMATTSELWT